jgi:membrane-associated protein
LLAGPGYFLGHVPWVRSHLPAAMAIVIGVGIVALVIGMLWQGRRKRGSAAAPLSDEPSRYD